MNRILTILLSLTLLSMTACSHKRKVKVEGANRGAFLEAAKQPIYSVNLIKKEIPENLVQLTVVYQAPRDCKEYWQELLLLNSALGDDLIDKKSGKNEAITIHLGQMLGKQVASTIPFNSIVKSLSGAKKHEKKRLSALVRGQARRSYLKGWAEGARCENEVLQEPQGNEISPSDSPPVDEPALGK